ncbi:MAG: hypothetical protein QOH61_1957 [Chloroflexota bacterium]|jgi:hypothetical protein|nr:hypothetical protein [Chloroflexota bacterium]
MRKLSGVLLVGALIAVSGSAVSAATDGGTTTATVSQVISVAAPATIAFGAGVPNETLSVLDSTVTVISNNAAGYTLSVQGTDLTKTTNTIPLTALSFRNGVTAYAALVAVNTDVLLATTSAQTDADGTDHLIDAQLVLPFIEAGNYAGTFTFTASNI